jgi:hypothetical protein
MANARHLSDSEVLFMSALGESSNRIFSKRSSVKIVRKLAEVFDSETYLADYSDVRETGVVALDHYMRNGCLEGRILRSFLAVDPKALCESGE